MIFYPKREKINLGKGTAVGRSPQWSSWHTTVLLSRVEMAGTQLWRTPRTSGEGNRPAGRHLPAYNKEPRELAGYSSESLKKGFSKFLLPSLFLNWRREWD